MNDIFARAHHPYGPSRYNAWARCPRWWPDENGSDDDAAKGAEAHDELCKCLSIHDYVSENQTSQWAANEIKQLAYKYGDVSNTYPLFPEQRVEGTSGILKGVFGTMDATWYDDGHERHIADLKTFSDGTQDYIPQLYGYGALCAQEYGMRRGERIVLHILHGMTHGVETVYTDAGTCLDNTEALLGSVTGEGKPKICKWCKWCANVCTCKATSAAVDVVASDGTSTLFQEMSLCQKLVVCDAVSAIAKRIKDAAKAMAKASPDHAVEMDGIRYELKTWNGAPKCNDICGLASAITSDFRITKISDGGSYNEHSFRGITPEEFIGMCNIPKAKVVEAIARKNADVGIKKVDIERFLNQWFVPADGTPHFVRVK